MFSFSYIFFGLLNFDETPYILNTQQAVFISAIVWTNDNPISAINEALTAEVQRLKLATGEITEAQMSKSVDQQMPMNARIFQLHQLQSQQQHQQTNHMPLYQFQSPQQQQQISVSSPEQEQKKWYKKLRWMALKISEFYWFIWPPFKFHY